MNKQKALNICERLRAISFYFLAAGVAFSNAITEMSIVAIISTWIICMILKKEPSLPAKGLSAILFVLIFWNLLSFINTEYMSESLRGVLKVIKLSLLFMATAEYFSTKGRLKKFILFVLGFGFLISLNGIIQYITGVDIIRGKTINPLDHLHRVSSSFRHANDFGAYLIVIATIFCSLFFSMAHTFRKRILITIAASPVIWCLWSTDSRGAWLGFIFGFLFLAMIKSKKLFVSIILFILIFSVFIPSSVKDRFSDFSTINASGGTVYERIQLWKGTFEMVKIHPVIGFGVNTYTKNFPKYKPKDYPDVRYTHNSYLHMAAEVGVVGAGIFTLFLLSVIITGVAPIRSFSKGVDRDLALGMLAGVVGFLAHCAVDTHIYSVTLSAFLFLCLGTIVGFRQIGYEKNS
ncbi:O-antigen ligase family protein [Candidatus Omnitrophota bacterium]